VLIVVGFPRSSLTITTPEFVMLIVLLVLLSDSTFVPNGNVVLSKLRVDFITLLLNHDFSSLLSFGSTLVKHRFMYLVDLLFCNS
jgi:hypothetical protein